MYLVTYGIPGYKITFYRSFLFYVYYVISTIISPSSYNVIHKVVISLYTPSIVFTTYTLIADHNPHWKLIRKICNCSFYDVAMQVWTKKWNCIFERINTHLRYIHEGANWNTPKLIIIVILIKYETVENLLKWRNYSNLRIYTNISLASIYCWTKTR